MPSGVAEGCTSFVSEEDMELSLRTYYEKRGWNSEGIPTEKTVSDLGLSWFSDGKDK
ncbi:MAG: aldehyde ferredoxin oxidoreductase C-terminal domain-containing protein [Thermoplasmata archaeon]